MRFNLMDAHRKHEKHKAQENHEKHFCKNFKETTCIEELEDVQKHFR